jgi:type IX secretion system PorP/SprF family membrane protein
MRGGLTILILVFFHSTLWSQSLPTTGQVYQFMPGYNPAFTGIENFYDLKISYRYQWSGLGAEAPTFLNVAYSMRLKQPIDLTYNSLRSSHTTAIAPENYPRSKTLIHGFGVTAFHESYKPTVRTGAGINYSLHYALARKLRLALGVGVLYEGQSIGDGIIYRDPSDPRNGTVSKQSMISARAGLLLYSKSFYLGVAYLPLWYSVIEAPSVGTAIATSKATAQLGFSFQLTPEFAFKPSATMILMSNDEILIDYSAKAFIQQRFWFGVTYRDIESTILTLGFDISNSLSASYAYELSTGDCKQFGDSTHELVLGVRLNNFKRNKQFTW